MSTHQPRQVRPEHPVAPRLAGIAGTGRIVPALQGVRLGEPADAHQRTSAPARERAPGNASDGAG